MTREMRVLPIHGIPLIEPGDELAPVIYAAIAENDLALQNNDVLVVAQKIVSKSEGRQVALSAVTPSARAIEIAEDVEKDPRLVELILRESVEVVRKKPGVLITRHVQGHVVAHAGVDQSNIDHGNEAQALLLPENPDRSATRLCKELQELSGTDVGVIVSDSANRPFRLGTIGIAIGAANTCVLDDRRGGTDLYGRELKVTMINHADSIATAASLVMGETSEKVPVALVRGLNLSAADGQNAALSNRPVEDDLFR